MPNSSISSYKLIANQIIKRIQDGIYPPGSYLPSENMLAKEFDVTRVTVRKALDILKSKGTLESFQGKGYKVRLLHWEQSLLQFYSFGKNIAEKIHKPATKVLSYEKLNGLEIEKKYNEEIFTEGELWKINRLRLRNNLPLILETSYIPVKFLPEFKKEDLKQISLYTLLENNQIIIIKAREYLETTLASEKERELLEIETNTPLFKTLRYTYNSKEELVEIRKSLIRSDNFNFSVEMSL